jgi:carboxypeptidase C (cathepsin A)
MKLNVTKSDFVVRGLEDVQPAYADFDGDMYAGRLPADNGDRVGETMFWMFEPATQSVPDTLVIWLNGGALYYFQLHACMDACMMRTPPRFL